VVLGVLLIIAGLLGVTGREAHIRLGRVGAWIGGGLSGFFGALIGNQGGLRAAAMLAFDVPKEAFVATATATALIVDAVRMPIYAVHESGAMASIYPEILIGAAGVHRRHVFRPRALRPYPRHSVPALRGGAGSWCSAWRC